MDPFTWQEEPESGELLLSSVPYSKGVQFGEGEVVEMLEALAAVEGPAADVRPKR